MRSIFSHFRERSLYFQEYFALAVQEFALSQLLSWQDTGKYYLGL